VGKSPGYPWALRRLGRLLTAAALVLSACASTDSQSRAPQTSTEPRFLLLIDPDGFCPAGAGQDVTFHIDAGAPEPVTAVGADGRVLHVRWPKGFYGGTAADPVVRDAGGRVVARNGELLMQPPKTFASLHGHDACFGGDTIWVQA
jgi:hypothetical protein